MSEKYEKFVNKIIDLTMEGRLLWSHYNDNALNIKDDNGIFIHTEFCMLDTSRSYYTCYDDHFIILAFEKCESGKDGTISYNYRLLVGEQGKHGYIHELKFDNDACSMLAELSYHIKDSIMDTSEKAEAFIDSVLDESFF